jgi:hypothetical protein
MAGSWLDQISVFPGVDPRFAFTASPSRENREALSCLVPARFMGHMRPWRQARPHWDYATALVLKAATTGRQRDVAAATDQMERALRTKNWL